MTSFRFRLEKVLVWRRTELELAEARFKQQAAALAELDRRRAELEAAAIRAEFQVRAGPRFDGSDLAALASFRRYIRQSERDLAGKRVDEQTELENRQRIMLEARRRCRLLERLRDRRVAQWQAEVDREVEDTAAESFMAGLARGERLENRDSP